MTYDEWEASVPADIKKDALWSVTVHFDTSKSHPEPVEGRLLRLWHRKTRSNHPELVEG